MSLFMKLYWMFGIMAFVVCFINPLIGLFGVVAIFIEFFMLIWEINMRQRLRYYQNPEKLYNIGKNIKGSEKIHNIQMKALPYSAVAICIGGKILAVFGMFGQVITEVCITVLALTYVDRGYHGSTGPLNILSEEQYRTVGIPLSILAIILSVCMSVSFWKRCDYYKKEIKGELK